ncbi:MAG: hypothetical protein OEW45_02940 [Deltaproteobacteria bacterium]|jgi:hypothetical protein|nr:hypothetical protein [Deltaproteobacteria bacterium]
MALWDMVRKGAEEGLEALKGGVAVFMTEAGRKSKIIKKKVELSSVQNNVRKTFIRLGSAVYDIHTRGEQEVFGREDVKLLIDQVDSYKTRVREIELEIEAIKKEEGPKTPEEISGKESTPPINPPT